MIHHLNRAAGLCLTAALLLTAAGCGQQTVPESPSPSPVVETAAADKNDLTVVRSMELQYANNFAVDYVPTAVRSSPTARDRSSCGCPRGERRRTTRGT